MPFPGRTVEGWVNWGMPTQLSRMVGKSEVKRWQAVVCTRGPKEQAWSPSLVPATRRDIVVCPHSFRKITRKESASKQVKLEAGRDRSQLRGGTLRKRPPQRVWQQSSRPPLGKAAGRCREASRQELAAVPSAWGWRSTPGTFEGRVPQTQVSRWRPHSPCHRVPPAGEIKPNKVSGSAQTSRSPPSPVSSRSSPSPELGARASVCKQTGHVAAAARSPPLAPREPLGRSRGTSLASPQPSWAAWCAGARPPPRRTARTRADSAPRPRATGQRSLYLAAGCPVPPAPGSAAPKCLATKDCTADSGAPCALLKPQSPPPPPPLPLRIPPSPGRGLAG